MNHPPETRLTSRELAERICDKLILSSSLARAPFSEIVASITVLIDAWVQRGRDTAHAAAIQVAADRALKVRVSQHDTARDIYDAILAITPVDAQRLYDLRIAEAVRDEAQWWSEQHCRHSPLVKSESFCSGCQRLASASAEVERLKEKL